MLPLDVALGDRDEVGAKEHAAHALMSKRRAASGDARASLLSVKSAVPSRETGLPGMNFSVAGLGVASVWMNIAGVTSASLALTASGDGVSLEEI